MAVTHEAITPFSIGGAGAGNTYRFRVSTDRGTTLSTCERDVAYDYQLAGLPVPAELEGPYDSYGRPATN